MNRNRVRTGRRLLLFALVIAGCCGASQAQTQMLLPFTEPIFQSTWANPVAQPLHRFSVGLPLLSSVEAGVVHNGFTIAGVGTLRGRRWYIDGEKLEKAVANQSNMLYGEAQIDLLHYRMAWRNWFFWFGARAVADATVFYPSDLVNAVVHGNNAYLGKELDMTGLDVISKAYSEFTLGASTFFGDWGVGARVSLLNGIFCGEAKPGKLAIEVGDDKADMYKHTVHVKGTVRTAGIPYKSNGRPDFSDLKNNIPSRILNFGNPGVALSAGVSYRPERHPKITFSFSDLGFIHWGNKLGALAPKSSDYTLANIGDLGQMLNQKRIFWRRISNELKENFKLDTAASENAKSFNTWLSPKFHLIGTYTFAKQTSLGLSFDAIIHRSHFYPSVTASVQQGFSNLFLGQLAISYNQRSFLNLGAGLVFCPGPVQFYVVTDNFLGFIKPSRMNATNLRLGINLVFGPLYPNSPLTYR